MLSNTNKYIMGHIQIFVLYIIYAKFVWCTIYERDTIYKMFCSVTSSNSGFDETFWHYKNTFRLRK